MTTRKRRSLDDQLAQRNEPAPPVAPPTHTPKLSSQPGGRSGKKAISGFFEPEVARKLKTFAAQNDRTVQGLLGEALNLLFEKYGLDTIAQSDE